MLSLKQMPASNKKIQEITSYTLDYTAVVELRRSQFNRLEQQLQLSRARQYLPPPTRGLLAQAAIAGCDLEIYLSPRQLCDTELICNGGFSPLTGFMTEEEYMSVVEKNRLPNGLLFGLPVVYDTDRDDLKPGKVLFCLLAG